MKIKAHDDHLERPRTINAFMIIIQYAYISVYIRILYEGRFLIPRMSIISLFYECFPRTYVHI